MPAIRPWMFAFVLLAVLLVAIGVLAPMAFSGANTGRVLATELDESSCVLPYVQDASHPPSDAQPIICEGPLCRYAIGVSPEGTFNLVGHEFGAIGRMIACQI